MTERHWGRRVLLLCAGLTIMALGVAFSIKGDLGTSPISSLPYVSGVITGLSVGTTTIVLNCLFVLAQILILRRRYQWVQLLQIPAAVLFGGMIDVCGALLGDMGYHSYLQQWGLCAAGIVLVALGVSMEVRAELITTAGEGVVLAVCQLWPVKFGTMKVVFDWTLVCVSVVLALIFLGGIEGVREGTAAAALFVGLLAKYLGRKMERIPL